MAFELDIQSATGKSFLRSLSQDEPSLIVQLLGKSGQTGVEKKEQTINLADHSTFESFEAGATLAVKGKYFAVTLCRVFRNFPVSYLGDDESKVAVQVIYHNLCGYRIAIPKMTVIDSDGFQHDGSSIGWYKSKVTSIPLKSVDDAIEDLAKTKGWVGFDDDLDSGVIPQRLIFELHLFKPGNTSGWVLGEEVIEFFIKNASIKQLG